MGYIGLTFTIDYAAAMHSYLSVDQRDISVMRMRLLRTKLCLTPHPVYLTQVS